MTKTENEEPLEGNTLNVYAYVAREGKPVGTREVTRGANLSSPSVAFRHLQKLEALGLLEKNEYGNYMLKEKANVQGYVWIGKNLVPRLMVYGFFFTGALITELTMLITNELQGLAPESSFLYLTVLTIVSTAIFFGEGIVLLRRAKRKFPI
jgi:DNA-binding transcriptional ArsR family regulator